MNKSTLNHKLLYRWLSLSKQLRQTKNQGFTLTEVLVSLVIAGFIVSGLLFLVVELLRTDQREIVLEQVQGDMQRAMDYISDDLREAIYVYSDPVEVDRIIAELEDLDAIVNDAGITAEPVLLFWRTDEISDEIIEDDLPDDCSTEANDDDEAECNVIRARRATYTLVGYYQREQFGPWEGESMLRRYELAQYNDLTAAGGAKYDPTPGFVSPLSISGANEFEAWESSGTYDDGTAVADADGTDNVLVDFVNDIDINAGSAATCDGLTGEPGRVLFPVNATRNNGFIACVQDPGFDGEFRGNQDVFLFLQGDATAASQFLQPASERSRLPSLQTQIKLGGIVNLDK